MTAPYLASKCLTFHFKATTLIALSTLLVSCAKTEEQVAKVSDEPQELQVAEVIEQTLYRVDQLPGEIQAYQDVAIYPKVPGFIDWIGVDRGTKVKRGQLMVRLIAPELYAQKNESFSKARSVSGQFHEAESKLASARATLLEANAQLTADNDTYTRTKEASLVPGVVAPNDVVVLEQKVQADKEKVKAWQQNVIAAENAVMAIKDSLGAARQATENYKDISDYLKIVAPFDGYVTERNMHVGSFVGPLGKGAYPSIVRVQQLDLLRIVAPVPEANVGGVLPGAPVEFTVSTYPGIRFTGTVARIGNYLDQRTRTMPVELNYPNPGWRILPGMFCQVFWPTRRPHPSLFVPPTAVETNSTLSTFVCLVRNDSVQWVPVERGEIMNNMTEIFGDIKAGDKVALHCTDALKPGTKVRPVLNQNEISRLPLSRPSYQDHGTIYAIPNRESADLALPENKGKPKAF